MLKLSIKWAKELASEPETGMDYQITSIFLKDGRKFDQVVIVGACITKIKDVEGVPFTEDQIERIIVTHDKRNFDPRDS